MRREGRQRGWVRVYDRELVDPEGKRRAVHAVEGQVVANGGFIRAPRKPTNQSKSGGRRALGVLGRKSAVEEDEQVLPPAPAPAAYYGYYSAEWPSYGAVLREEAQARPVAAVRSGGRASCKGSRHKSRHHLKEICYFYGDEINDIYGFDS